MAWRAADGFNLAAWTSENGSEAYLQMLRTLAELVSADRLNVFTRTLNVSDLSNEALLSALRSHRQMQDSKTFRERTVFLYGDEAVRPPASAPRSRPLRVRMRCADDRCASRVRSAVRFGHVL